MAYCTVADIEQVVPVQELAELTTERGDTPDYTVVEEAITKADALIDSYCSQQYAVPFVTVPELIKSLSLDIAVYRLYLRRRIVPDPARQRYEDAVGLLRDLSAGRAKLPDQTSTAGAGEVSIGSNPRLFVRSYMYDL